MHHLYTAVVSKGGLSHARAGAYNGAGLSLTSISVIATTSQPRPNDEPDRYHTYNLRSLHPPLHSLPSLFPRPRLAHRTLELPSAPPPASFPTLLCVRLAFHRQLALLSLSTRRTPGLDASARTYLLHLPAQPLLALHHRLLLLLQHVGPPAGIRCGFGRGEVEVHVEAEVERHAGC